MLRSSSLRALVGCGLLSALAIAACSGSKGGSGFDGNNGSSGGNDNDGGYLGSSGGPDLGDGGGGPVIGLDAACASQSSKGQLQPLDMYIMLDQSGSMKDQNKWQNVTAALNAFVGQSSMAGVGVGLQYFGVTSGGAGGCQNGKPCGSSADCSGGTCVPFVNVCACGGGGGDSCNAADYAKPEIEIEPLPGVAPKITASIQAHGPTTGTPTSAALQGAVDHAKAWSQAHAGHVTIAVLATDGEPEECDTDLNNIDAIAATAAGGNPKILTFVIGVGSSLSNLNGIAQAGGTGQAYIVDTGGNAQQQFLDALNKIRGQALGCVYTIPLPDKGQLDFNTVNVQFNPGDGSPPVILPKVNDKGSCPASGDAWYYDNNSQPTQIILCDTSCSKITGAKNGEVDIVVGCGTVVK